jgi:hypothetical protein
MNRDESDLSRGLTGGAARGGLLSSGLGEASPEAANRRSICDSRMVIRPVSSADSAPLVARGKTFAIEGFRLERPF